MILIKLQGGLGNQMFQFAFAAILAKKNKTKVFIEDSIYNNVEKKEGYTPRRFELSIFNNQYRFANKSDILLFDNLSLVNRIKRKVKLNYPKKFTETEFEYCSKVDLLKAPVYLKGYFQSFKYFQGYEDYIRNLFVFPIDKFSQENLDLISILKNQNTIAIHIRRGDYVTDKHTNHFHGVCSLDYYTKGILETTSKIDNPTLVFFSDDSDWVKQNFDSLAFNKIFINHNIGKNSWIDMYLMSICSHNIIANSSFSWWAAWLNNNSSKIVVAPKKWFQAKEVDVNSIIPEEWITI